MHNILYILAGIFLSISIFLLVWGISIAQKPNVYRAITGIVVALLIGIWAYLEQNYHESFLSIIVPILLVISYLINKYVIRVID